MPNIFLKNEFLNFSSTWIKPKGLHYTFHIKDAFGLRTLGAAIVKHKDISGAPGRMSVFEKGHIYSDWPTSVKVLSSGCVSGPVEYITLVTQWRGKHLPNNNFNFETADPKLLFLAIIWLLIIKSAPRVRP